MHRPAVPNLKKNSQNPRVDRVKIRFFITGGLTALQTVKFSCTDEDHVHLPCIIAEEKSIPRHITHNNKYGKIRSSAKVGQKGKCPYFWIYAFTRPPKTKIGGGFGVL